MIKLCFLYFVWKSVEVRYWISLISRTEKDSNRVSWKLIRIPQTYNWIIFFRWPLSTATLKRPTTAPIRSYFEGSEDGSTRKHPTPYIWYIYVSGPAELRDRGAEGPGTEGSGAEGPRGLQYFCTKAPHHRSDPIPLRRFRGRFNAKASHMHMVQLPEQVCSYLVGRMAADAILHAH